MIKSLEELKKIREEYKSRMSLRQNTGNAGDEIEILIGMATCGISSGARETLKAFAEQTAAQDMNNVRIVTVGCLGYCHSEPTVQVNMPRKEPVLYGNVKKERVHEIVENHLKNGSPVQNLVLRADFERA